MSTTREKIEEIRNPFPSETSLRIIEFQENHKLQILTVFGNFIKTFEDIFDFFNTAIYAINYVPKKSWGIQKSIQFLFFPQTLKTIYCGFDNFLRGYYDESVTLLRSAYETAFRTIFISCFPKEYESVFYNKSGQRQFNLTNFLEDILKIDCGFVYRIMSKIGHSKVLRVQEELHGRRKGQIKTPVSLKYEFDFPSSAMCVNFINLNLALHFQNLWILFYDDLKSILKEENFIKGEKVKNLLLLFIQENSEPAFSKISADLEKIASILTEVKYGKKRRKKT